MFVVTNLTFLFSGCQFRAPFVSAAMSAASSSVPPAAPAAGPAPAAANAQPSEAPASAPAGDTVVDDSELFARIAQGAVQKMYGSCREGRAVVKK
jgi:hypothetical protein